MLYYVRRHISISLFSSIYFFFNIGLFAYWGRLKKPGCLGFVKKGNKTSSNIFWSTILYSSTIKMLARSPLASWLATIASIRLPFQNVIETSLLLIWISLISFCRASDVLYNSPIILSVIIFWACFFLLAATIIFVPGFKVQIKTEKTEISHVLPSDCY